VTSALLEQYLAGDRESERRLFERHRADLVSRSRSASWMAGLRRYATPEDLVQEVFVRALSSGLLRRLEHRGSGSLRAALAKILDDVAVDTYRRHGALKRGAHLRTVPLEGGVATGTEGAVELAAEDTTPTSTAREREILELCRALLPPREWDVWWLCEVRRQSSAAVAERTGTTDAAVRGILHRARKRILRELAARVDLD
jgi:RNA polymerase sigma factor (sigma-70 family)